LSDGMDGPLHPAERIRPVGLEEMQDFQASIFRLRRMASSEADLSK
jgi:hypothetical protein